MMMVITYVFAVKNYALLKLYALIRCKFGYP